MHNGFELGTFYRIQRQSLNYNHERIQNGIDSLFRVINLSMSTYIPSSKISRINNGDSSIIVDAHFVKVFKKSTEVFLLTNGYFDPTVGSWVNAYGFGPENELKNISDSQRDSIQKLIGWNKISLTIDNKILKQDPNIYIDFNSLAKGYMIDVINQYLLKLGSKNHLIEIGGEIIACGKNPKSKKNWKIAIENPLQKEDRVIIKVLPIINKAIATSGNYRKFRIDSLTGKKYVHLIDPITGIPVKSSILSVSVKANDCMTADAFATSLMVMNLKMGIKIVEENSSIEAYWIVSEGDQLKQIFSKNW